MREIADIPVGDLMSSPAFTPGETRPPHLRTTARELARARCARFRALPVRHSDCSGKRWGLEVPSDTAPGLRHARPEGRVR
jgi:hypothetical protein